MWTAHKLKLSERILMMCHGHIFHAFLSLGMLKKMEQFGGNSQVWDQLLISVLLIEGCVVLSLVVW